jgi:hypothetical protein
MKFKDSAEFQGHWNTIDALANDNVATSHMLQMRMLNSGDERMAALSAWKDIMPEHVSDPFVHNKVFEALFETSAPLNYTDHDKKERNLTYLDELAHGVPSQFESDGRRNSFGHLIDALKASEEFSSKSYQDIADMLFKPYVVFDGGAHMTNVFLAKDLKALKITQDDMNDSANYPMFKAIKEGKELVFTIEGEEGFQGKERLRILKQDLMKDDPDASIWTATQPSSDGESMEVVLMTGDMNDRNNRQVVARWHYLEKDKNGKILKDKNGKDIMKRLMYTGVDEQLKVLSAYKRGNFMDIDNDGDIYDSVERWINEGESGVMDSIPGGLEELITAEYQPMNIGKFEFRQVVEPFWKKYGPEGQNLSKSAFAAKWEEVRRDETYAFEDKYFETHWEGLLDLYRPSISPMRHGVRQTKVRGYDPRRRDKTEKANFGLRNSANMAKQLADFRRQGPG